MSSPCLSAGGVRFLDLPVPTEESGLPSEDRRACRQSRTSLGLPRFAPVRRAGGGCRLYSGAAVSQQEPSPMFLSCCRAKRVAACLAHSLPCQPSIRQPDFTEPQRRFTCVHPSQLSFARIGPMVGPPLGLPPPAFARFVTWRLRGAGTGMDTSQDLGNEPGSLILERPRVAMAPS
jgi:hypothetical protein